MLTYKCFRTPDSSRFWPAPVVVGEEQPSYDKQYIRDHLTANGLKGKSGVSRSCPLLGKLALICLGRVTRGRHQRDNKKIY